MRSSERDFAQFRQGRTGLPENDPFREDLNPLDGCISDMFAIPAKRLVWRGCA